VSGKPFGLAQVPRMRGFSKMVVYVDDAEPVFVEQLTLDEARTVLARSRAELPNAFNSAHAAALRSEISEVEGQIAWLEAQEDEAALQEAAVEHACDLWADRDLGVLA
jgi:hypothetical protein